MFGVPGKFLGAGCVAGGRSDTIRGEVVEMDEPRAQSPAELDVLIVGAGPTGLTLAGELARFRIRFRIIDKAPNRAHESRALAVQARSLEVLQCLPRRTLSVAIYHDPLAPARDRDEPGTD